MINCRSLLVTGGTGSFGRALIRTVLAHFPNIRRVVVFSRDELKQYEMAQELPYQDARMRFFIGDVRDTARLNRALEDIDYVVHAAALKHVPIAEYNPFEAIKTNVIGAQNVIDCAIDRGVRRVIALSTDKAANPINLYGATKLCSDKLFVAGNAYAGARDIAFSVVRYGNVVGSRGSVVPFFLSKRKESSLPITDPRMTRFWITIEQGVQFVLDCLTQAKGGEIFVPKIPSMRVSDLAKVIAPEAEQKIVGIRPGEKLHEVMITEDDVRNTVEFDDRYIILPPEGWHRHEVWWQEGRTCADGFRYASDTNDKWLDTSALEKMIAELDLPEAKQWASERGLA